eukprot:CAMPEP_0113534924 /NCGR_PEP_ID=MMETSP0015_2-20120614/5417_1 /TAXON_ID=2838 /ORGANISM="Odontella" /LENGTH=762 /DNA_ID=CAMNT_0000434115 /DNA_START=773 /DNA_END=3061 /DNA_ORIENTATION=- /assembly_acc=CAM_ASM_000160
MKKGVNANAKTVSQKPQRKRRSELFPVKLAASAITASRPKPCRPPSAYSLFFKQERKKLRGTSSGGARDDSANGLLDRIIANGGGLATSSGSNGNASSDEEDNAGQRRTLDGDSCTQESESATEAKDKKTVLMNELAKIVSRKWKALDESSRSVFEALALLERKKYERELEIWNRERKVEEEQHSKGTFASSRALTPGAGTKTFLQKELTAISTKRKRDDSSSLAVSKTKKKAKATIVINPLKSKQILPHMLGSHGRGRGNRFGVPKHVMERAFSKSRGQSRERSSSNKKQQKQVHSEPISSIAKGCDSTRFSIPIKTLPRMNTKQQAHKTPTALKKNATVEVSESVRSQVSKTREELRTARLATLGGGIANIMQAPQHQIPSKDKSKVNKPDFESEKVAQDKCRPSLLPSIAAVLGMSGAPQRSEISTSTTATAAGSPAAPSNSPHAEKALNVTSMSSFDIAFDEYFFETVTPAVQSPPQSSPVAASILHDPLVSVMDLVSPLSRDGSAPTALALHAQALVSHSTSTVPANESLFRRDLTSASVQGTTDNSPLQPISLDSKPAFPNCDILLLQNNLQNCQSGVCCSNATNNASQLHKVKLTKDSSSVWPEGSMDLAEPTPLGSTPLASPTSIVEEDLNSSIAAIFGVGTTTSSQTLPFQQLSLPQGEEEDPELHAPKAAYAAADADLFNALSRQRAAIIAQPNALPRAFIPTNQVEPDQVTHSSCAGSGFLSAPLPPCHEVGENDGPLDKTSIDFLMAVFE